MSYAFDHRFPIAVIRLAGQLRTDDAGALRDALLQALLEEPTSLIVDLSRLESADRPALEVFAGVAARAVDWPGTSVLLCAAGPVVDGLLHASQDGLVGVHPTFAQALAIAATDPVPQRLRRRMEPRVHAPRVARALAAEACAGWNLPGCVVPTEILASELVTNAVRHAATPIDLQITYLGDRLRVSVHDRDERMARLQTPAEFDDHGRGLLIVDSIASRWGTEPVSGGKVVWATLDVTPRGAANLANVEY